jgi:hypothetical protein
MQSALHITTKVLPGNRVEVQLPEGSEGQEVNIFVVLNTVEPASDNRAALIAPIAEDSAIQAELAASNPTSANELDTQVVDRQLQRSVEALARIRSRPRVNPQNFGLPDSTELIREDRNR